METEVNATVPIHTGYSRVIGVIAAVQVALDAFPDGELQAADGHLQVAADRIGAVLVGSNADSLLVAGMHMRQASQYSQTAHSGLDMARSSFTTYLAQLEGGGMSEFVLGEHARARHLLSYLAYPSVYPEERPATIHSMAASNASAIIADIRRDGAATPERLSRLRYAMALEHQVAISLRARGELSERQIARRREFYADVHNRLIEEGEYVDIIGTYQDAETMPAQEVVDYFTRELEDYHVHLTSSIDDDSTAAANQPEHYVDLIAGVREAVERLPDAERAVAHRRLSTIVSRLTDVLFVAGKLEHALAFGSQLEDGAVEDDFITRAAEALRQVRVEEDGRGYRQLREYGARVLPQRMREKFIAAVPREAAYAPPDGNVVDQTEVDGSTTRTTIYSQPAPLQARLTDGRTIEMPYTDYQVQVLQRYDTDYERDFVQPQSVVEYEQLTADERAALETAVVVADNDLRRTETLPYYRRLAFKKGEGGVPPQLATVVLKDGVRRRLMDYLPDDHGMVSTDASSNLAMPVRSALPVQDGYMVVPYDGDSLSNVTFQDMDPNFFGPGDDRANAFAVTGSPRIIVAEDDARLMREEAGGPQGRFIIVPVRYYQVAVDQDAEPYGYDS